MSGPRVGIVIACARNGVIGRAGGLPWRLPEDLAHFRRITGSFPVVMGRRTWESLPQRFRPLPGRRNLVLTAQPEWTAAGAERCATLAQALIACRDAPQLWVIGGARLVAEALTVAECLEITEIDADFEGDTSMPAWDRTQFIEVSRETQRAAEPNAFNFSFVTYHRRT